MHASAGSPPRLQPRTWIGADSAPVLGAGGREFESRRPDQSIQAHVGISRMPEKSTVDDFEDAVSPGSTMTVDSGLITPGSPRFRATCSPSDRPDQPLTDGVCIRKRSTQAI